jgi:hypothetical protein
MNTSASEPSETRRYKVFCRRVENLFYSEGPDVAARLALVIVILRSCREFLALYRDEVSVEVEPAEAGEIRVELWLGSKVKWPGDQIGVNVWFFKPRIQKCPALNADGSPCEPIGGFGQ